MKTIGVFSLVVTVSLALLQPAQGRSRGGGSSFSPAHNHSASTGHFSGRSGGYARGSAYNHYRPTPRYASQAAFRNRAYSASGPRSTINRSSALNPRTYSSSGGQLAAARRSAALRSAGVDGQGRIPARYSQNWDRNRDHHWHGHRCRWHNNAWVIIDPWFYYPWAWGYPWGYGYYGYGYPYGYYADAYYEDVYAPNGYAEGYYGDPLVSQVQSELARKGYYRGAIDGSLGPVTRSALRQYQLNHGLESTGRIDQPVIAKLGLQKRS